MFDIHFFSRNVIVIACNFWNQSSIKYGQNQLKMHLLAPLKDSVTICRTKKRQIDITDFSSLHNWNIFFDNSHFLSNVCNFWNIMFDFAIFKGWEHCCKRRFDAQIRFSSGVGRPTNSHGNLLLCAKSPSIFTDLRLASIKLCEILLYQFILCILLILATNLP